MAPAIFGRAMQHISVVIITRNEGRNIGRCIASVQGIAHEVIVVDAESTDDTRAIAERMSARVVVRAWTNYSDQKNFANGLATGAYILSLDADEALSPELTGSLRAAMAGGLNGAYRFNRLTNYCGTWVRHGGWYPDAKVRLFPREGARWEGEHVHEVLRLAEGMPVTTLKGDLFHHSYHSLDDHRERIERYSTLHARALHARGKHAGWVKRWLSPVAKFVQGYVLQGGFLDGAAGFHIARFSARAVWLKYAKLHQLEATDSIGDVMLTLPMTGLLKQRFPGLRITFLGRTYTAPVLGCCQHVDQVLTREELEGGDPVRVLRELRADVFIHVFPDRKVARWAQRAGIPMRIGTAHRWWHWTTCTDRVAFSRKRSPLHEARLNLKLLAPLGIMDSPSTVELAGLSGFVPGVPDEAVRGLLRTDRRMLIVHPLSKGSAVEWGLDRFSALIGGLDPGLWQVVITGTEAEAARYREGLPLQLPHVTDAGGRLSLHQLIALIGASDALVAASTGPLHIAAACGKRAIGLYSPRRPIHPGRWAPIGPDAHALVAEGVDAEGDPVEHIRAIPPEAVLRLLQAPA